MDPAAYAAQDIAALAPSVPPGTGREAEFALLVEAVAVLWQRRDASRSLPGMYSAAADELVTRMVKLLGTDELVAARLGVTRTTITTARSRHRKAR